MNNKHTLTLSDEVAALVDKLIAIYKVQSGIKLSRPQAIAYAARLALKGLDEPGSKTSDQPVVIRYTLRNALLPGEQDGEVKLVTDPFPIVDEPSNTSG